MLTWCRKTDGTQSREQGDYRGGVRRVAGEHAFESIHVVRRRGAGGVQGYRDSDQPAGGSRGNRSHTAADHHGEGRFAGEGRLGVRRRALGPAGEKSAGPTSGDLPVPVSYCRLPAHWTDTGAATRLWEIEDSLHVNGWLIRGSSLCSGICGRNMPWRGWRSPTSPRTR